MEGEVAKGEAVSEAVFWQVSYLGAWGAALRRAGIPREVFLEAVVVSEAAARQETGNEGATREPRCGIARVPG